MDHPNYNVITADALAGLQQIETGTVQCAVTSPPYWALRDYGTAGQLGRERTPEEYIENIVAVLREVRRVLRDDGCLWLNLGDTYATTHKGSGGGRAADPAKWESTAQRFAQLTVTPGVPDRNLIGVPWRVALALQRDGWMLRADIIWHKPNAMPESVRTRPTRAHEYVFLLTKSADYFYDADAVREEPKTRRAGKSGSGRRRYSDDNLGACPSGSVNTHPLGRNLRTVWEIPTAGFRGAHFATFPERLAQRCILASSRAGDLVLDPFSGAATTGVAALRLGRRYVGVELNPEYVALSKGRIERELQPEAAEG